jgi:hypothetical protein
VSIRAVDHPRLTRLEGRRLLGGLNASIGELHFVRVMALMISDDLPVSVVTVTACTRLPSARYDTDRTPVRPVTPRQDCTATEGDAEPFEAKRFGACVSASMVKGTLPFTRRSCSLYELPSADRVKY